MPPEHVGTRTGPRGTSRPPAATPRRTSDSSGRPGTCFIPGPAARSRSDLGPTMLSLYLGLSFALFGARAGRLSVHSIHSGPTSCDSERALGQPIINARKQERKKKKTPRKPVLWVRGPEAKAPRLEEERVDPDPAGHRAACGGRGARGRAGGGTAGLPAPAGGGVEVLACIVPGREPCFFLPGTPRWRPGARGPKQTKAPGPGERGGGRLGGGAGSSPGGSVSGAAAPQDATGGTEGPQGDGSRLRASHSRVSWDEKGNHAQLRPGTAAGRPHRPPSPAAGRQRTSEKQARAPRPLRPRPPQPGAPRPPTHRWRV